MERKKKSSKVGRERKKAENEKRISTYKRFLIWRNLHSSYVRTHTLSRGNKRRKMHNLQRRLTVDCQEHRSIAWYMYVVHVTIRPN